MEEPAPNRIRYLRDQKGWSLRELAKATGIDFNALSRLERGTVALDTVRMRRLANVFQIKISELLNDEDVEFRADERSMELLRELSEVPESERTALLVSAREVMRVARNLAAQTSAAGLRGNPRLASELADIYNQYDDDAERERALELLRISGFGRDNRRA